MITPKRWCMKGSRALNRNIWWLQMLLEGADIGQLGLAVANTLVVCSQCWL